MVAKTTRAPILAALIVSLLLAMSLGPPVRAGVDTAAPRQTTSAGPLPHQWMENATPLTDGYLKMAHGELTEEDGGRDAFSFTAHGGSNYIVEVEGRLDVHDDGDVHYVDNHLVDPSILEIVNQQGVQLMGPQDGGGLLPYWARGYFVPESSGAYFVAVGSGQLEPSGTGHYTITVRQDDHADDRQSDPEIVIRPGESIEATINSDVSPDHPGLHPWDWAHWGSTSEPLWAVESLDDRDVFRFEIDHEGTYRLEVTGGPDQLGIMVRMGGRRVQEALLMEWPTAIPRGPLPARGVPRRSRNDLRERGEHRPLHPLPRRRD